MCKSNTYAQVPYWFLRSNVFGAAVTKRERGGVDGRPRVEIKPSDLRFVQIDVHAGPLAIVVDSLEEAFHGSDVFRRQCEVVTERSHRGFDTGRVVKHPPVIFDPTD